MFFSPLLRRQERHEATVNQRLQELERNIMDQITANKLSADSSSVDAKSLCKKIHTHLEQIKTFSKKSPNKDITHQSCISSDKQSSQLSSIPTSKSSCKPSSSISSVSSTLTSDSLTKDDDLVPPTPTHELTHPEVTDDASTFIEVENTHIKKESKCQQVLCGKYPLKYINYILSDY